MAVHTLNGKQYHIHPIYIPILTYTVFGILLERAWLFLWLLGLELFNCRLRGKCAATIHSVEEERSFKIAK